MAMDLQVLEEEALKLPPLEKIQLAELLYASLEPERDRLWAEKVSGELDSRWTAYQSGEMKTTEGFEFLSRIEARSHK
ncbi:addiction module protein [Luteolibacter sp. LG18]|uniref:addiction module protein n=1 Tax=Luteolibacter sp. LG18 TaxID=2819286 RepID=UPI0030C727F6